MLPRLRRLPLLHLEVLRRPEAAAPELGDLQRHARGGRPGAALLLLSPRGLQGLPLPHQLRRLLGGTSRQLPPPLLGRGQAAGGRQELVIHRRRPWRPAVQLLLEALAPWNRWLNCLDRTWNGDFAGSAAAVRMRSLRCDQELHVPDRRRPLKAPKALDSRSTSSTLRRAMALRLPLWGFQVPKHFKRPS